MTANTTPDAFKLVFFSIFGLFTLPFLLAGPYFIVQGLPNRSMLKCDRVEPTLVKCQITNEILGWQTGETEINQLKSVGVETIPVEDSELYRLVLQTPQGETPFGLKTSDPTQAQTEAERINQFIQSTQPTLTAQQSQTQWSGIIVGGGFLVISTLLLLVIKSSLFPERSVIGDRK